MAELTFLVSVFDSARFLPQCIHSLKAQTAADFACILVDDGLTDGGTERHSQFYFSITKIEAFIIAKYGLGSLSEKEYHNKICRYIIGKALKFRKRAVFCEYAKKLPPMTFKEKLMHFVPTAYYWLFVLYHRKTRSRK